MLLHMLLAGFGGQGILFAGKVAAQVGMLKEKQVSWLPSYGPEMRGGTANCSVCIDDAPIGSPIVSEPQTLIVMNAPSFDKFSDKVKPGGMIVLDSSLIEKETKRTDINIISLPATEIATKHGLDGFGNMVILGAAMKATRFAAIEELNESIRFCVPEKKQHLLKKNFHATKLGFEYQQ